MIRESDLVQSVLRACVLLKTFRADSEVLALSDFVDRTGLRKTTVFRLLRSLERGGLVELRGKGSYRRAPGPFSLPVTRIGYAAGSDSEFSRQLTAGLEREAARENVEIVVVNNRFSPAAAMENAEFLIRERVDLIIEHQGYERIAPKISSRFREAGIPVIALEVPHPEAVFFGPDNYQFGIRSGRTLGRWAQANWPNAVEEILLLELPNAGNLLQLRSTGMLEGILMEVPAARNVPCVRLDCGMRFDQNLNVMRKYLRRRHKKPTLVCAVNDICGLAALGAFEEAGGASLCAVMSHTGTRPARDELRRPGTRLVGTVAFAPERWGAELIPLAIRMLQRKQVPEVNFIKYQLLTAKNVDLFYPLDTPRGERT